MLPGRFQFQSGAIKRRVVCARLLRPAGFNSNLVRLSVAVCDYRSARYAEFQFQSGAIKRFFDIAKELDIISFNSNLVRLSDIQKPGHFWSLEVSIPIWCD